MIASIGAYTNHLEYLINTKLGVQIPESLRHDISCALYDYGVEHTEVVRKERDYWCQWAMLREEKRANNRHEAKGER